MMSCGSDCSSVLYFCVLTVNWWDLTITVLASPLTPHPFLFCSRVVLPCSVEEVSHFSIQKSLHMEDFTINSYWQKLHSSIGSYTLWFFSGAASVTNQTFVAFLTHIQTTNEDCSESALYVLRWVLFSMLNGSAYWRYLNYLFDLCSLA